jgi:uncharacterized protein (DUF1330 family)
MSAYVIVDIRGADPVGYEEYQHLALPAVKLYGGRYLARCDPNETLEGDWHSCWLPVVAAARLSENIPEVEEWLLKQVEKDFL